jgi:membrane protein DedA with SNARE-associated domain
MSDWIFSVIDSLGSLGVGLLVLMENLVPPIPSEVILPLAVSTAHFTRSPSGGRLPPAR